MNQRLAGVLVGIAVVVAGRAGVAAAGAGCTNKGTSLYFGNGINTTYDEAWEDADDDLPGLALEAKVDDVVAVGIAYNHTDGFLADVIQTLKQKEEEDPRFGWYLLNNISGYLSRGLTVIGVLDLPTDAAPIIATLQTVINEGLADSDSKLGTFYDADVADQVSGYDEDLAVNGYRVVVVAHSQGTLYANAARAALAAIDSANLGSFGIAAVGDAAEITFNGYVTSDSDLVINALRTLGRTVLPANIHVPVNTGDFTGHLFEATYINAQLPARRAVVALLSTVTQGLAYPAHATARCAVGSTGAVAVSVGYGTACALTAGGGAQCWGQGTLGDGTTNGAVAPVQVVGLEKGVKSISVGYTSTCAVTADGAVECWGLNNAGKLGNGSTIASPVPVPVTGLAGVATVSVGDDSACAITASGGVVCWGDNIEAQLGDGSRTNSPVPVAVVGLATVTKVVVGTGAGHACALNAAGEVWCWGLSGDALGIPSPKPDDGLVPVQVTGLTAEATDIGVGTSSACAIIMGGGVMCWGSNMFGQLGAVLTPAPGSVIVRGSQTPVSVTGLPGAAARISVGGWTTCAVLVDGSVQCWGNGGAGQLGNGSKNNAPGPVQVTGLVTGFTGVSVGPLSACAVDVAGGVQCWGDINGGFLGNNQAAGSLVPVHVAGFPGAP